MIDFGFDKIALIGAVALIVIGPEKLPRVARTVGHLLGKAQRYVAEVKAEVNRSIELDELKKMKEQVEEAARDVNQQVRQTGEDLRGEWKDIEASFDGGVEPLENPAPPPPRYQYPRKNWRLKRAAVPRWYKQRHGVRMYAQSGAARVARYRPPSAR